MSGRQNIMERSCRDIWAECLKLIKEQVSPKDFQTWIEPIKALKFENNVLTIKVASVYVHEYLEEHFIGILGSSLERVIGSKPRLMYQVVMENRPKTPLTTTLLSAPLKKPETNTIYLRNSDQVGLRNPFERTTNRLQIDSQLNPSYTMESFIKGSCNALAKAAGMEITKNPGGTTFNPLLIYGGSGLGKTHLAQAIGLEVKRNFPEKVVLYLSTNLFQTQFTEAIRRNEINDFLHFYQLIDVLILDDIQELAGKTATQNTFFHIFNHLQQLKKQLILTCDKAPAELTGIEERLLSRFKWGLSAEIKSPDFETRKEIVLYKARKDGIEFAPEVIDYICKYVNNNVRELEGVMISLLAQATFNRKDLTVDLVKDVLAKTVRQQAEELTVDKIQQVVCSHFSIDPKLLQDKTRKREVVQTRYLAMYFCKAYTNASLSFIGNQIGNKDHATVLYACKWVNNMMETDRKFRLEVEELQRKLYR